ncbi:MAG: biliverdin-producing heme oxygenase [Egicoccus sp.]
MAAEPASFAARLRAATAEHHRQAETTPFVRDLLAGMLPLSAYALLASQHWFVYDALERVADQHTDDDLLTPFLALPVRRLPRLQDDLGHLVGRDWAERIEALPATRRYVDRLETVAAASAPAFLAHHYTRYLGDLAGGQAVVVAEARAAFGCNTAMFADLAAAMRV